MPNSLIRLKGRFEGRSNPAKGGGIELPKKECVTTEKITKLRKQLETTIRPFWLENIGIINNALISVHYGRIIPKSRRISRLFSVGSESSNESIIGVKYAGGAHNSRHVITYCITMDVLDTAIQTLVACEDVFRYDNTKRVDYAKFEWYKKHADRTIFEKSGISMSKFLQTILDLSVVEKVEIPVPDVDVVEEGYSIISLYNINGVDYSKILSEQLGIRCDKNRILGDFTFLLDPDEVARVMKKMGFLIAMSTSDINLIEPEEEKNELSDSSIYIPHPNDEPVVGVIDTVFDSRTYIREWVEYDDTYSGSYGADVETEEHGTKVTSLIVDGPTLNPRLDDGCGRFRVKHFCITKTRTTSRAKIMRDIEDIVSKNSTIKVWNLSLGSNAGVSRNFISPEAALLDRLQTQYDVIFIVAGTNLNKEPQYTNDLRIGAPADSINSIVVNATSINDVPASYSRHGGVLSFFVKPDVCCFGGDYNDGPEGYMHTRVYNQDSFGCGTSFAAPWITRKVAFLVEKMGLSREIAKALIIDSAIGWAPFDLEKSYKMGYGVVPRRVEELLISPKDEIKFYVEGVADQYEKYNFRIPVPMKNGKYPFMARATMCYFPSCARSQGVDYTQTELDLYFGRLKISSSSGVSMATINRNNQSGGSDGHPMEYEARKLFRKWDNVKHIKQLSKMPLSQYDVQTWGLKVQAKERVGTANAGVKFGIVITLKEIHGENRYDDFIQQCALNGWIASRVDIDAMNELYSKAQLDLKLSDD